MSDENTKRDEPAAVMPPDGGVAAKKPRVRISVKASARRRPMQVSKNQLPPLRRARMTVMPGWMTAVLLVLGIAVVVALAVDFYHYAHPNPDSVAAVVVTKSPAEMLLAITTAKDVYRDPKGRFSVAVPGGWQVAGTPDLGYDLTMEGPNLLWFSVMVTDDAEDSIETLKDKIKAMEQELQRDTHIQERDFKGHRAISRFTRMSLDSLCMIDLLDAGRSFHLVGKIPADEFERGRPVLDALMETFQLSSPTNTAHSGH